MDIWRFLDRLVDGPNGCWEWTMARNRAGYGEFCSDRRVLLAHRWMWEFMHGPIPPKVCVLHRCDNPPCVNPSHLFLGTRAGNARDMIAKGRDRFVGRPRVLSTGDVLEMRRRYRPYVVTCKQLAAEFGVTPVYAWLVIHRKKRTDVP
jgi:hypothetical protein